MPGPVKLSASLLDHFATLEDPRAQNLLEHQLLDIIALSICAIICGADTWVEIEQYGKAKESLAAGLPPVSEWDSIPRHHRASVCRPRPKSHAETAF